MTERDYFGFFLWGMAFMIAVGGMIKSMWPSLVRFVDQRMPEESRQESGEEQPHAGH